MKVIAINGSPRRGANTDSLLKEALRGAEAVGAETEMIRLYDLTYRGCISCFGCKRKGAKLCHYYMKDELSPVLEKVLEADVLLLGSPIYEGEITAQMRGFLERLGFITMTYDDYSKVIFEGSIDSAFFFTMNAPEEYLPNYMPMIENNLMCISKLGGSVEHYESCNTLQFNDYSKFHAAVFDEELKKKIHEEQYPKDLAVAYEIGYRLASKKK